MTRAFIFWIIAALLVVSAAPTIAKLAAIVITSGAYMRLGGRDAPVEHALLVGAAWFLLDIVTDLVTRQAFDLTGSSSPPIVQGAMCLVWLMSPAVFARNEA